jgi:hypothetical protein
MAYNFPSSPAEGQEYIPPMGGQTYVWYSPRWMVKGIPPVGGEGTGVGIEEAPMDGNQYGRQDGGWGIIAPNFDWSSIPGKPATFPADPHTHPQSEVVGLTAALNAKEATITSGTTSQWFRGDKTWQPLPIPDWSTIAGKPSTFPPSTHNHPQNEITNLVPDLAAKAPLVHTHPQTDVTGLVGALAGKEPTVTTGTTTQFWRGDKTWQPVPAGDWSALTGKPATYPPSGHSHVMTDITGLQAAFNNKSDIGHIHDYSTLSNIPNTFAPAPHAHGQSDITNLVTDLAEKASLTSPVFTGTVTLPVTNVLGALTGVAATFSSTVRAVSSYYVKPGTVDPQNVHLWFQGFANEDRAVLYTSAAALGSFVIRVGGAQSYSFGAAGMFTSPVGITSGTGAFSGALSSGAHSVTGTITATGNVTSTAGHVVSANYSYANAGYFIGAPTLAVVGTTSGSVGDVALRPSGYNTSAMQTLLDGATGNLSATGWVISNNGRHVGTTTTVVLCNNGTGAGTVYLRPNGSASGTGQMTVSSAGDVQAYRSIDANGNITAAQNFISSTAALVLSVTGATGNIYFRGVNNTTAEQGYYQYNGNFTIGNQGYKAVAGSWAASSDGRIKTVVGDYMAGLKEILQLKVRRYTYKGNETLLNAPEKAGPGPYEDSPHRKQAETGEVHISLIAQEAEAVMPDLVTRSIAWIDGVKVDDFRTLNPTNVTWALINAVQEMAAKIQTLEGEIRGYTTGNNRAEYPRLVG